MIVSFEKSFLFVHVPKTGGTSMRAVLSRYRHDPHRLWTNRLLNAMGIPINYYLGSYQHYCFRTHDPLSRAAQVYPPELMERLFKFAVVRNPWDLLVSYWGFIRSTPGHKRHRRVARLDFAEFLSFAIAKGIGRQKPLLVDRTGQVQLDYIGRFENLSQDFLEISQRLQIGGRLPHANRGGRRDYRAHYTPRTRQLVHQAYAEDIDAFEYEFEARHLDLTRRRAA